MRIPTLGILALVLFQSLELRADAPRELDACNVVWTSPSREHSGSMPLGNGDISVNAWVEESGDLVFFIGKTDSWDDNGRLLKVGKVRVSFNPPLVKPDGAFKQTLDLRAGTMRVEAEARLALRVDANHPCIDVEFDGDSATEVTASIELWRTNRYELPSIEVSDVMTDRSKPNNMHAPTIVEPDTLLTNLADRIGWFHHNIKSVGPAQHAETQGVADYARPDPLLHRTFGAVITADRAQRVDDTRLKSPAAKRHRLRVHVLTQHPATPEQWLAGMDKMIAETAKIPESKRRAAHADWWSAFWDRSWILAKTGTNRNSDAAIFPANDHPFRIGEDQSGGNKFRGEMRNVVKPERLAGTFTLEAEVRPAARETGRIFDKVTPGGSDGFLIDAYPGNSLRLINGSSQYSATGALPAGEWARVVAVADAEKRSWRISVNGKTVIETEPEDVRDDAAYVSQMYALQRYITACAGRGRYPIKFNGSIFTVPHGDSPGYADYRRWGPGYWWQNTRLPYISLCAGGDFELFEPLLRTYVDDFLPLNKFRTQRYFGFENAAYYIECVHFWGDAFNEVYGWTPTTERKDPLQTSGWHKWEWVAGPELVYMMLDLWEHTGDDALLKNPILPTAHAVIRFFDLYYKTDANGRLVMHPAQAAETWWDCTNPMTELSGLIAITKRLLALPESKLNPELRAYLKSFEAKLPPLPVRDTPDGKGFAPAEKFAGKRNSEVPELYCVFPFRLASFNRPNAQLGINALNHRWDRGNNGWRQDDVFMAYLGLTNDARRYVVGRARSHDKGSRFPAFWGPNYDWIPDQDHGGILTKTFQAMVMQAEPVTGSEYDGKIYLLPAWPAEWDVKFKLHAPQRTTIEVEYRDGKIEKLDVQPASRREDVIVMHGKL